MIYSSCEAPGPCDCIDCEYETLVKSEIKNDYKPTLKNYKHQGPNVIPQIGDYMVATKQHYVAIKESGMFKMNTQEPHERMGVMYIGEHGLSQCTWGSPAQVNGRAIHCETPGHWKLGLTPLDGQNESQIENSTKCYVKE